MSGLLGVWNSQQKTPWQAMLDDLDVLGRDGKGAWHNPEVGISLGRTQFFNTPESALEEPVIAAEGCLLVWSGRIDDREALQGGNSRHTDGQLIISAYRRWGEDCLSHLMGEYVFILWDMHQDLLIVGCDTVGTRPIAYYWDGQTLLLSSRVVTLLHHPQVSLQLDERYITYTLCNFWGYPAGITPFRDIKRLLPGQALILKAGKFALRQIAQLTHSSLPQVLSKAEDYYEQFWSLLNQAIKDRLRTRHSVCTTLSGGLDSTTIAIGLLNHLPALDAFSTVTEIHPEFDERQPIRSFLKHYPQVNWHDINGDQAWTLSEPWDQLPVPDDPVVTCTLASSLQLNQNMREQGFSLCFDGEGGDELFRVTLHDLAASWSWPQFFRQLRSEERWHSSLWWECILPYLPSSIQAYWFERSRKVNNPFPKWLKPSYIEKSLTQEALWDCSKLELANNQVHCIKRPFTAADFVGNNQVFKLTQAFYGIEFTSPILDQRLIEFAINLPPALQQDSVYGKIFLRNANHATLPDEIRWKPKENYFDPLKYAGIGQGEQVLHILEKAKNITFLQEACSLSKIESSLKQYRSDYLKEYSFGEAFQNNLANELYAIAMLCIWHEKVFSVYG